jgi:hypothetical protein
MGFPTFFGLSGILLYFIAIIPPLSNSFWAWTLLHLLKVPRARGLVKLILVWALDESLQTLTTNELIQLLVN